MVRPPAEPPVSDVMPGAEGGPLVAVPAAIHY